MTQIPPPPNHIMTTCWGHCLPKTVWYSQSLPQVTVYDPGSPCKPRPSYQAWHSWNSEDYLPEAFRVRINSLSHRQSPHPHPYLRLLQQKDHMPNIWCCQCRIWINLNKWLIHPIKSSHPFSCFSNLIYLYLYITLEIRTK